MSNLQNAPFLGDTPIAVRSQTQVLQHVAIATKRPPPRQQTGNKPCQNHANKGQGTHLPERTGLIDEPIIRPNKLILMIDNYTIPKVLYAICFELCRVVCKLSDSSKKLPPFLFSTKYYLFYFCGMAIRHHLIIYVFN